MHFVSQGRKSSKTVTSTDMQGVIRSFDSVSGEGIVVSYKDRQEFILAANALEGSLFRNLRQGQRINFELDNNGNATQVRIGSESDMGITAVDLEGPK